MRGEAASAPTTTGMSYVRPLASVTLVNRKARRWSSPRPPWNCQRTSGCSSVFLSIGRSTRTTRPCASSRARCCWKSRGGSPVRAAARGLSLTSSIPVPHDGCCGQPTTCAAEEATTRWPPQAWSVHVPYINCGRSTSKRIERQCSPRGNKLVEHDGRWPGSTRLIAVIGSSIETQVATPAHTCGILHKRPFPRTQEQSNGQQDKLHSGRMEPYRQQRDGLKHGGDGVRSERPVRPDEGGHGRRMGDAGGTPEPAGQ